MQEGKKYDHILRPKYWGTTNTLSCTVITKYNLFNVETIYIYIYIICVYIYIHTQTRNFNIQINDGDCVFNINASTFFIFIFSLLVTF